MEHVRLSEPSYFAASRRQMIMRPRPGPVPGQELVAKIPDPLETAKFEIEQTSWMTAQAAFGGWIHPLELKDMI